MKTSKGKKGSGIRRAGIAFKSVGGGGPTQAAAEKNL